jgi:hypothetical protein
MLKDLIDFMVAPFRKPSAEMLALHELEDAKRMLLEAHSAQEYALSMCEYHQARVERLTNYLHHATGSSHERAI